MNWQEEDNKARERRKEQNTPWPKLVCKGCGEKYSSSTNYVLCDKCACQAYDVLM